MNFIFCTDVYLLDVNVKYLNHDYYTDIITFDNSSEERVIEGDIFISVDRVIENASIHSCTVDIEMLRVIIHGVLHLLGWEDNSEELKIAMREKETRLIELYNNVPRGTPNEK